jgi:hypothetical protein
MTILSLGRRSAEKAALKRVDKSLESQLKRPKAIPCPECGHYQSHMIPVAQNQRHPGIWMISFLALVVGSIAGLLVLCAFIAYLCQRHIQDLQRELVHPLAFLKTMMQQNSGTVRFLRLTLTITLWSLPPGIFLWMYWKRKVRRYDPNAEDPQARILKGQRLTVSQEDYERLLETEPVLESLPKGSFFIE